MMSEQFDLNPFLISPEEASKVIDLQSEKTREAMEKIAAINEKTVEQIFILKQHERISQLEAELKAKDEELETVYMIQRQRDKAKAENRELKQEIESLNANNGEVISIENFLDEEWQNINSTDVYTRLEDMSPSGRLQLLVQPDGDICIQVIQCDDDGKIESFAGVEFCSIAFGGGGSPRTLNALRNLICAINLDNKDERLNSRNHEYQATQEKG